MRTGDTAGRVGVVVVGVFAWIGPPGVGVVRGGPLAGPTGGGRDGAEPAWAAPADAWPRRSKGPGSAPVAAPAAAPALVPPPAAAPATTPTPSPATASTPSSAATPTPPPATAPTPTPASPPQGRAGARGAYRAVVRSRGREEAVEHTLSADELRRIPGGQNDALRGVQNLPGVARAPFSAGQLVVWGSAPGDTRVYADGVYIPRIYHFGGLRSTLNSEFITDLTFRPGAYGADYGRGLGGVINVTTRAPRKDGLHGSVTLDLIDGSFTLEGPLSPRVQVAAAARVSWISALLPLFTGGQSPQLSPFYWDYQATLRYQATSRDDLDVSVFGSTSDVSAVVSDPDPNVQVDLRSKSYFSRLRLRWQHRFSPTTVLTVTPSLGADTFSLDTGSGGIGGQQLNVRTLQLGYNLRAELRHRLLRVLDTAVGLDFEGLRVDVDATAPGGPIARGEVQGVPSGSGDQIRDAGRAEGGYLGDRLFGAGDALAVREQAVTHLIQAAPYAIARFELFGGRLLLSPQLRLSIDHLRGDDGTGRTFFNLEPRLLIQASLVPDRLRLVAGAGIYHQPPQGSEISSTFGNPALGLQTATTFVLGADVDATSTLRIEAQAFYKDLRDLVVQGGAAVYNNEGVGRVYGGELLVRQRLFHDFFGWIAYTVSRSERRDHPGEPFYLFRFDQTHILTALGTYRLPFWGLEVGVRFRYVTGNPTTPTLGGVRVVGEQRYVGLSGERNSVRLPDFHQLDVRIDKSFHFRRWKLGVYLDLQNVYNRRNTEYLIYGGRQLYQVGLVGGLPFFPDLGARAEF